MNEMNSSDVSTSAQVSVMAERMTHLSEDVREMRKVVERMESMWVTTTSLQKDTEHMGEKVANLYTISDLRGAEVASMDKRVLVLERWYKTTMWFTGIVLTVSLAVGGTAIGYAKQFVDALEHDRRDTQTRLTALEFIVNSSNFEARMKSDRPAAAGKK